MTPFMGVRDLVADHGDELGFELGRGEGLVPCAGQRLPDFPALADVPDHRRCHLSLVGVQGSETDLDRELGAIAAAPGHRHVRPYSQDLRPGQIVVTVLDVPLAQLLRDEKRDEQLDRLAEEFVAGISEKLFSLLIDQRDAAVGIHDDHCVRRGQDKAAETFLGLDPLGHVAGDRGRSDHGPVAVPDRGDGHLDLEPGAVLAHPGRALVGERRSAGHALQKVFHLARPFGDQADGLAHDLRHLVAVEAFRCGVPAENGAVEGHADDCVVSAVHNGGQPGLGLVGLTFIGNVTGHRVDHPDGRGRGGFPAQPPV
jgi:hypothetical protein